MVLPGVIAAFMVGLVLEAIVIYALDRRAIRKEAAFWEELRLASLDGAIFDWADCEDFGCCGDEP